MDKKFTIKINDEKSDMTEIRAGVIFLRLYQKIMSDLTQPIIF